MRNCYGMNDYQNECNDNISINNFYCEKHKKQKNDSILFTLKCVSWLKNITGNINVFLSNEDQDKIKEIKNDAFYFYKFLLHNKKYMKDSNVKFMILSILKVIQILNPEIKINEIEMMDSYSDSEYSKINYEKITISNDDIIYL